MIKIFNDVYFAGSMAGIIATIIGTSIDYLLFRVSLLENDISTFVASIILPELESLSSPSARLAGLIAHLIMGAIFGMTIIGVIYLTHSPYHYLTGMFVGAVFWLILHQALVARFWVREDYNLTSKGALYQLLIHLIEGLTVVAVYKLLTGL